MSHIECFHEQWDCKLHRRASLKYQTGKLLKWANCLSSDFVFFFLTNFHHNSMIMGEAFTTIQMQTNSIHYWVLHTLLIVIVELKLFFSDSQAIQC